MIDYSAFTTLMIYSNITTYECVFPIVCSVLYFHIPLARPLRFPNYFANNIGPPQHPFFFWRLLISPAATEHCSCPSKRFWFGIILPYAHWALLHLLYCASYSLTLRVTPLPHRQPYGVYFINLCSGPGLHIQETEVRPNCRGEDITQGKFREG